MNLPKEKMLDEKKKYHVSFCLTPDPEHCYDHSRPSRVQTLQIREKTLWENQIYFISEIRILFYLLFQVYLSISW